MIVFDHLAVIINHQTIIVTKRKRYSAVGETEVDQEELLQSAKKRSREDVDDEVGGWRDVDDELDGWRDDLDKSF